MVRVSSFRATSFSEFSFCYFLPGGFLNATLCGFPPSSAMMPFFPIGGFWFGVGRKSRDRLFKDPCKSFRLTLLVRDVV